MFNDEEQIDTPVEKPVEPPKDEQKEIREELASLRNRLSETENNAKYWYEQAKGKATAPAAVEEEEEVIELKEDLVDVISSGDVKKIKETFKKLGFVDEKEVKQRIAQTRQQIAEEAELFGPYPDLKNPESELFKEAAKEYGQLAKQFGESPKTLALAARIAAKSIGYEASTSSRRQPAQEDDDEADRVRRVNSQSGSRGRSAKGGNEGPDEFSPAQKSIIDRFQAVGSSLTPEGYRKRAETGVRMSARSAGGFGGRK
jgi:hypothetical protein